MDRDNAVDILFGGDGNDVISAGYGDNVDGGDGEDKLFISFQGATEGVAFDLSLTSQTIGGGTIQNIEGANWIEGSEFNDVILGESLGWNGSAPVIFGMGGDDSLVAGYYTGALYGGDGNDSVDGRKSQYLQRVEGGAGNDTLYTNSNTFGVADGGDGNDLIYAHGQTSGGGGDDIIQMVWTYYSGAAHGDDGNDDLKAATDLAAVLYGDAGGDTLTGSGGNDYLDGGTDVDSALGGAGNDTYVVDNTYDVVAELLDEGTDTVRSSASFAIGAYIEALMPIPTMPRTHSEMMARSHSDIMAPTLGVPLTIDWLSDCCVQVKGEFGFRRRMDSPFNWMRWALWTSLSRMASA